MADKRMKSPVRQDVPPFAVRNTHNIVRVEPGRQTRLILLNHRIYGFATHYGAGKTMPCQGDDGSCDFNHETCPPHWQGWVGCLVPGKEGYYYVALTPKAFEAVEPLQAEGFDLRGQELILWRQHNRANAPMMGALQRVFDPGELPDTVPDVPAFIERLWNLPSGTVSRIEPPVTTRPPTSAANTKTYTAALLKSFLKGGRVK